MATRRENSWILALLAVGLVPLWQASCVPVGQHRHAGTGGSSATAGTSGTAGDNGTAGTSGEAGTTGGGGTTDPAGRGGTTGSAGDTGSGGSPAGRGRHRRAQAGPGGCGRHPAGAGGSRRARAAAPAGAGGSPRARAAAPRDAAVRRARRDAAARRARRDAAARRAPPARPAPAARRAAHARPEPRRSSAADRRGRWATWAARCPSTSRPATGGEWACACGRPIAAYGGQVVQSWTPASGGAWPAFDTAANHVRQADRHLDADLHLRAAGRHGGRGADDDQERARAQPPTTRIWITRPADLQLGAYVLARRQRRRGADRHARQGGPQSGRTASSTPARSSSGPTSVPAR